MSEARTNGPSFSAVFQTVIEHTMRIAVAAPRAPEAQRGPQERGEHEVGNVALGRELGEHQERDEHDPALGHVAPADAAQTEGGPGEQRRRHDQRAAASPSVHVLKTSSSSDVVITPPRRSDSGPKAALTSAATSAQPMKATTSDTWPSPVRPLVRRRISSAATTSATVFPIVWASTVPSGVEKSPSRRSPITMPGTSRGPYRTSTARPSPAGGQIAATAPSR